jgi:hypothetical protein
MRALEVSVNGRRVCVAGIRQGVLAAHVTRNSGEQIEFIDLDIVGLEDGRDLRWSVPKIGIGGEVTVRVVDATVADPPKNTGH